VFFENIVKQIFDMVVVIRFAFVGDFPGIVIGSDGSLSEFFIPRLVFVRVALHADVR
jgi:hypothetical protein